MDFVSSSLPPKLGRHAAAWHAQQRAAGTAQRCQPAHRLFVMTALSAAYRIVGPSCSQRASVHRAPGGLRLRGVAVLVCSFKELSVINSIAQNAGG